MDIALVLDKLVLGGNWQGSVTSNTREAFDKIRWNDERTKPTWEAVKAKWSEIEPTLGEAAINEEKIQTKIRELAVESLKAKDELPENYK